MKTLPAFLKAAAFMVLMLGANTGCESTGGSVSGSLYYGTSWYDPWYYGPRYGNGGIIVNPPPRPDYPPKPTHPIANPPSYVPRPMPMPSIPSTPRPMPRGR